MSTNQPTSKSQLKKQAGRVVSRKEQIDEIIKCGSDPIYFINTYITISHPKRGAIKFETYPFQDDCIKAYQGHRFVIVNKSRQLGLSTISAAYSLWMALFQKEKEILVIATKLETAKLFIKKVRSMFTNLPKWLVLPSVTGESVKYLEFSNGSKIQAVPTAEDGSRGVALSLLIVDECISPNTYVTIRNKTTGEVRNETIGNLFTSAEYK